MVKIIDPGRKREYGGYGSDQPLICNCIPVPSDVVHYIVIITGSCDVYS